MSEESAYWSKLVSELQDCGWTIARIAENLGVEDRTVSYWKEGKRPIGMAAIKLRWLHAARHSDLKSCRMAS